MKVAQDFVRQAFVVTSEDGSDDMTGDTFIVGELPDQAQGTPDGLPGLAVATMQLNPSVSLLDRSDQKNRIRFTEDTPGGSVISAFQQDLDQAPSDLGVAGTRTKCGF
jgi:hypothetical protein